MRRFAVLASLLLISTPVVVLAQSGTPAMRQIGSATLQNVPEIPADVKAAVQRYQNYREAVFQDWLPDGSILITTRFGATAQVHRVAAPGGDRTQLSFYDEPVTGADAIPGSNRFVLGRDTGGDEWFQFYAMTLGGQPVQLTEPSTRNQSLVFSKDGRTMAWARGLKGSGDYAIFTADPANPASRKLVYQGKGSVGPADISADGTGILVERNISNSETQLGVLNLKNGQFLDLAWTKVPARYQDSKIVRGEDGGNAIITITDLGSDVRRLAEFDAEDGSHIELTPNLKWEVESFDISPDGNLIAYQVNEDGFSALRILDRRAGREIAVPKLPAGVITGMGFSPDGRQIGFSMTTARSAGDVWSWGIGARTLTRWTNSEFGPLDQATLAEPRLIRFNSFDGLSVPAFVYRPTGVATGTKTPVLIDIHGGPESQTRPIWNPGAQYFTSMLGATVILPNVRGSDGYGKRYLNLDNGPKREDSVKDIGALLDWVARQPDLDASRVAVYGQSYGGYMSLATMTHYSDRLVGGVERYGISDFVTFLTNTEAYRRDLRRSEYGDERDPAMRAVFDRINPLANVARIGKPMLVMQGANDPRVPRSESEQIVQALRDRNVEAWYVLFADEGHGFLKKPNNDLRREVETVFLRKLFERR